MRVFEVIFEVERDNGELENEVGYWSGSDLLTVCKAAHKEGYEYDKQFISARYVLTVVQQHLSTPDDNPDNEPDDK